jgi:hypothetical protein
MMRYCSENEQALGFVISQDGDIRAIMKHQNKLMLWENINVQLAYRPFAERKRHAPGTPINFPSQRPADSLHARTA